MKARKGGKGNLPRMWESSVVSRGGRPLLKKEIQEPEKKKDLTIFLRKKLRLKGGTTFFLKRGVGMTALSF